MIIGGVDVETTGLDPKEDRMTELALVLWDTDRGCPVKMINHLIPVDLDITPEITKLTGIDNSLVNAWGDHLFDVMTNFWSLANQCDYLMAHNSPFDQGFIKEETLKGFAEFSTDWIKPIPWINTMTDLPPEAYEKTKKLEYLAYHHGFLNPFAHRALFDVLTMLKVMSQYDLNTIIERSKIPNVRVIADVSFQNKDLAKTRGFKWNADRKIWFMEGKRSDFESEFGEYPFDIQVEEIL